MHPSSPRIARGTDLVVYYNYYSHGLYGRAAPLSLLIFFSWWDRFSSMFLGEEESLYAR
jgi:hypothetical protein